MEWLELLRETEKLMEGDTPEAQSDLMPWELRLFAWQSVYEHMRDLGNVLSEKEQQMFGLALNRIVEKGNIRELPMLKESAWSRAKEVLAGEYPHFREVNALVEMDAALSVRSHRHFRMRPVLLLGEPGLGKTRYARRLAGLLGLQAQVLSLATTSAGFVISGMDSRWEGARPGMVFAQLMYGAKGNPVIVVDEMDKATGSQFHDPMGAFFELLEPESAQEFKDEFLPIPIDARHITWIATANGTAGIPDPILSRMTIIEVPTPTRHQREQIVHSVYRSIREERHWGGILAHVLPDQVAGAVAERGKTPRDMRLLLEHACGRSAMRALEKGHGNMLVLAVEDLPDAHPGKQPIGFVG